MSTILVTGGAGFIGSAVVRRLLADDVHRVVNLDALTYAGNLESVGADGNARHVFEHADIREAAAVTRCFVTHQPDAVLHLAAESHVDRSIDGPDAFIHTNVVGTFNMLQAALAYWRALPPPRAAAFRFVHVSTDEVYGSSDSGSLAESAPYRPNSPYAASKAASDHLARAWFQTYGLPVLISSGANTYGPFQFPEKLIPLTILNALAGLPVPVYGTGEHTRDWLHVDDHVHALLAILRRGRPGEQYNVGGGCERRNIDVVRAICSVVDELRPSADGQSAATLITHVADRPGHDRRYSMDSRKLERELGVVPAESFDSGLRSTVQWYLDHVEWTERVRSGGYRGERLGLLEQPEESR